MKEIASRVFVGLALLTFVCFNANSQKEFNTKEFFVEAESYFLFEEYDEALPLYQRIYSQEPENYNVMYKIGVCYLNDLYQKNRSIKYLLAASDHINPKFKPNTYKENLAPLDALYYLGQAYRVNGELDLAIKYYTQFKNQVNPEIYNLEVVNAELESCETAKISTKKPVYNEAVNLGESINSRFSEHMSILSGDGKTLVFTRELQFYDAIFISSRDSNGIWSPPYNLTPDFGLDGNSYTTGISYKGDEIFVYRSDDFDGNIYSSKKLDKIWKPLTKLNENINTKYWESHASVSADGQFLYFTSNRKDGFGGLDIYRSKKDSKGEWGIAENLGPVINTMYNEETPFISPTDNKLFFSSLGHNGMGGYDIFVSEKNNSGKWSKPVNMGYPLNSTDDDLFFCPIDIKGFAGIYSFYNESTSYGLKDIYWVEVYNEILPRPFKISGKINVPSLKLLTLDNINASLIDDKTGKIVSQAKVDSLGSFAVNATQGSYQLLIDGNGIKPISVPVELNLNQKEDNIELALITTMASVIGEETAVIIPANLPKIEVIGEQYIITDTTPITISLNVEKGSDLKVETLIKNKISKTEEFHVSKDKFSYILIPEIGENKILFTVTNRSGNINQEEVLVYYTPNVESIPFSKLDKEIAPTALPEVAMLASAGLQTYLLTLGSVDVNTKTELYDMLIANAASNNYTIDDVNELFGVLLTQRNKKEFLSELNKTKEFNNNKLNDTILAGLELPISIVYRTKDSYAKSKDEINKGLISLVPYSGSPNSKATYVLSFIDNVIQTGSSVNLSSNGEFLDALNVFAKENNVDKALNLASTTQELESYYQNLLISTDGVIEELLLSINFQEQEINNSIDLVNYLLKVAPEKNISIAELITVLETSQNSRNKNLYKFRESLANSATGVLKTTIEGLDLGRRNINSYEQLLNALLLDSKTSGYNALEVYKLLLKLIGIEKVDELESALRKSSYNQQLDSLLSAVDLFQFSKPVELIQYLLSQSPYFDYTDSDINNLLLRMLLEKGVDNYLSKEDILNSKKLIKRRKLITTIVLVNALLIIFLLIFGRRKKKKRTE